jgi:single-strand DNA-binding protein
MLNKCAFIGNLGADAELRSLNSGDSVMRFRLACTEKWKDKNSGEKKEKTEWISCSLFGTRAAALSQYMSKGQRVYVEGQFTTREYEKDGQKRFATEIKVRDVILLGDRRGSDSGDASTRSDTRGKTESKGGGSSSSYDDADYGGGGEDDLPF